MKKLLKKLVFLLSVSLCIGIFSVWAEEGASMNFNYYNSFVVNTVTENQKIFTPNDFPEIHCLSVITAKKSKTEDEFFYELILVLQDSGDAAVKEATDKIKENPVVTDVRRNSYVDDYEELATEISLNHSTVFLAVGKTVDLNIDHVVLVPKNCMSIGVDFTVDPAVIDDNALQKNSFAAYGISRFWPLTETILVDREIGTLDYLPPDDLEAVKSENATYYGVIDSTKNTYVDAVNQLAQLPGVLSVSIATRSILTGHPPYEDWKTSDSETAKISVSGGNVWGIGSTVTVQGLKTGIATVSVERGGVNAYATANCIVTVYSSGDVNSDGIITASDALLALQHAVQRIELDKNKTEFYAADTSGDGFVTSTDALRILQLSIGK